MILLQISDHKDLKTWRLIANGDAVDLCPDDHDHDHDHDHDLNVYLTVPLANLISLWLGDVTVRDVIKAKTILLDGPRQLIKTA